MSIDFNYGRRTGVTTFKGTVKELCENLRKFQPLIVAWVNASSLSPTDKTNILNIISAVNVGCASVDTLPDD